MVRRRQEVTDVDFYSLRVGRVWKYFAGESFAFWMVCGYLLVEYVRPQSLYPAIDFLPWTQLTVIGAILGCFTDKTIKWVSSPANKLLILLFLIILASSYFAYFPEVSFRNLENYYLWVIIYILIINVVNTRKRFFIFISIFLLASFKLSLPLSIVWAKRGFSFTDWGLMGPPGFFQNSGELAIQMLVFWPISLAFCYAVRPYIKERAFLALTIMPITAIMVILGASSRGAQLALIVQIIILNYRRILNPKVLVAAIMALFIVWALIPEEQKQRFSSIGDDRTSQQRLLYWENGIEMISDNPVLGIGYFNFPRYFERYYPEDKLFEYAELPHNIFIQVGTDTGLLGLSVFLIFIAFLFKKAIVKDHSDDFIKIIMKYMNVSLIGYIVAGQFVTVAYYPFLWIHGALVVSMANILLKEKSGA